tara:strand:- start:458 stop:664 length:207 start_codon:yes stop_codon:yes gene_type:complete
MKTLIFFIGVLFLIMAALATPIAIGLGLYDWVGNDVEFKFALWFGFKSWILMLSLGLIVGFPCFVCGK